MCGACVWWLYGVAPLILGRYESAGESGVMGEYMKPRSMELSSAEMGVLDAWMLFDGFGTRLCGVFGSWLVMVAKRVEGVNFASISLFWS